MFLKGRLQSQTDQSQFLLSQLLPSPQPVVTLEEAHYELWCGLLNYAVASEHITLSPALDSVMLNAPSEEDLLEVTNSVLNIFYGLLPDAYEYLITCTQSPWSKPIPAG